MSFFLSSNRFIVHVILGGTPASFWGDVGARGAPGKTGGMYSYCCFDLYRDVFFFLYLAPGLPGPAGKPGLPGFRGAPGDAVC